MANGVARKVDQLGRVVLPVEMRKALRIDVGDLVMMSAEGDRIVLEKVEQHCVFCGASEPLLEFSKKLVCSSCVEQAQRDFSVTARRVGLAPRDPQPGAHRVGRVPGRRPRRELHRQRGIDLLVGRGRLVDGRATEHDHALAARLVVAERVPNRRERTAPDLLVQLRELTGQGDRPVRAAGGFEVAERREHPPRRLVDAPRCGAPSRSAAMRSARDRPLRGRNPSNTNRSLGNPDSTSAVVAASGPGTTSTAAPAATQARTRCAPGSLMPGMPASVTNATRDPSCTSVDDPGGARRLVVGRHRSQPSRRGDARVGEERARAPGVLARDDVGGGQHLDRTRREVAEVPDRRPDEYQRTRLLVVSAPPAHGRSSRWSPGRSPQRANAPASASRT